MGENVKIENMKIMRGAVMSRTVEQCDAELAQIDFEMGRLAVEREHVVRMKEFLKQHPEPNSGSQRKSRTPSGRTPNILAILKDNPGISGPQVADLLNDGTTTRQVTYTLTNLRQRGAIENRANPKVDGTQGRWYVKETNS
jgi:hypothetical protein